MEAEATTDTLMTDEVMTEQQPAEAAAAMETEDDAPPARLMITKMVRLSRIFGIAAKSPWHAFFFLTIFLFLSLSTILCTTHPYKTNNIIYRS